MILRKLLIVPIFFIFFTSVTFGLEIKIKAEIDNIIITNIDIENERKYLIFLNPKLKELNKEDLNYIVKNSLIREIIKEKELKKFFDINKKYKPKSKRERVINSQEELDFNKSKVGFQFWRQKYAAVLKADTEYVVYLDTKL